MPNANACDFKILIDILADFVKESCENCFSIKNTIEETFPVTEFCLNESNEFQIEFEHMDGSVHVERFEKSSSIAVSEQISISNFYDIMKNHIKQIDHTGIVFFENHLKYQEWLGFIGKVSQYSNLYKYPENQDWPFVLPSTSEEFLSDIKDFSNLRQPKFEIVYVKDKGELVIQIDVKTDLTRKELERLFPHPVGKHLMA